MSGLTLSRVALTAGLATFAAFIGFNLLPAVCGVYAFGTIGDAVSLFQRAETLGDGKLLAVFGNPIRADVVAAMNAVNTLDLYGFIPAYTLFLIAAAAALGQGFKAKLVWLAIAAAFVGAAGDVWETLKQLQLTAIWAAHNSPAEWPREAAAAMPIAAAHYVKYFGLSVSALAMSALAFCHAPRRPILAILGLVPIVGTAALFFHLTDNGKAIALPFAAFWIALLVVVGLDATRQRA